MNNDNIHYDYCRCCGGWTETCQLDEEKLCGYCWALYGSYWPKYKQGLNATVAPVSDEL